MKASIWFILLTVVIGASGYGQEVNNKMIDPVHEEEILIGDCNREGLTADDFGLIFDEEYALYEADPAYLNKIVLLDRNYSIIVVLGTWCQDSQEQVPRFYRILDALKFPAEMISIICVDGNKTGGDVDISGLNIEKVPTFIFYRNGEEVGRITETPENTLEQDMFEILK